VRRPRDESDHRLVHRGQDDLLKIGFTVDLSVPPLPPTRDAAPEVMW
jgi:hypothetical protein